MKKLFCLLLSVLLMFCCLGCNSEREDEEEDERKSSYKTAIQDYFEITIGKGTKSQYKNQYPEEYRDWYEDRYEESFNDKWEAYEDNKDNTLDMYEDKYGRNLQLSYDWQGEEEWESKNVDILAEYLNNVYRMDEDSVETVYEVEVEVTIKGEEDEDNVEMNIEVVKIDNKWYYLDRLTGGMSVDDMERANEYCKENPDAKGRGLIKVESKIPEQGPYGD